MCCNSPTSLERGKEVALVEVEELDKLTFAWVNIADMMTGCNWRWLRSQGAEDPQCRSNLSNRGC